MSLPQIALDIVESFAYTEGYPHIHWPYYILLIIYIKQQ